MSSYDFLKPVQPLHVLATIAAIGLLLGQLPFVINFLTSLLIGRVAGRNPWCANTLEWTTDSPPPHENFRVIPTVYRDPYEYGIDSSSRDWLPQDQPPPDTGTLSSEQTLKDSF